MSRRDFPALTGLRFFLALWVILHHLTGPGQKLEATALLLPYGLFTLIRGGYQAVTTFFVLSGFVLTRSYSATLWRSAQYTALCPGTSSACVSRLPAEPGGGRSVHSRRPDTRQGRLRGGAPLVGTGLARCHTGELEYSGVVAVLRDVFLCRLPAGVALHTARHLAQCRSRRRDCLLPDARHVGSRSLRQYQTAGPPERLSDGHRSRLRLRSFSVARAPAARMVALYPGIRRRRPR